MGGGVRVERRGVPGPDRHRPRAPAGDGDDDVRPVGAHPAAAGDVEFAGVQTGTQAGQQQRRHVRRAPRGRLRPGQPEQCGRVRGRVRRSHPHRDVRGWQRRQHLTARHRGRQRPQGAANRRAGGARNLAQRLPQVALDGCLPQRRLRAQRDALLLAPSEQPRPPAESAVDCGPRRWQRRGDPVPQDRQHPVADVLGQAGGLVVGDAPGRPGGLELGLRGWAGRRRGDVGNQVGSGTER